MFLGLSLTILYFTIQSSAIEVAHPLIANLGDLLHFSIKKKIDQDVDKLAN